MAKRIKILIGPSTFAELDPAPADRLIKNGFDIIKNPFGKKLTQEELISLLPGVQGLIAGLETLNRRILEGSNLKVISRCGAGVSNIDFKAADELGIKIFSTPDAPTEAVAELVVGAMLSLVRHIPQMNSDLHNGKWVKKIGIQLEGKTITIIGFGRIGRRVEEILRPFKMNILAVDKDYNIKTDGIQVVNLHEALPLSDIITIHASGDEEILGQKEFALMKKGIFLLNCARGNTIDEKELMGGLESGRIAGAWLDCFITEPYNGQLSKYPQVIMTPHVGSYTFECRRKMEMEAVDNIIKGFRSLE